MAERSFAVEGNDLSAYVGVSPEYQNYSTVAGQPFRGDDDADAEEKQAEALSTDVPDGVKAFDEGENGERVEPQAASYSFPAPPAPVPAPVEDKPTGGTKAKK